MHATVQVVEHVHVHVQVHVHGLCSLTSLTPHPGRWGWRPPAIVSPGLQDGSSRPAGEHAEAVSLHASAARNNPQQLDDTT